MDQQSDEDIECTSDETIEQRSSERLQNVSENTRQNIFVKDIYERDSMFLFGDDLTEQVIQYLWRKDKVKFQYVCKQWRRLIFNKQTRIFTNCLFEFRQREFIAMHIR